MSEKLSRKELKQPDAFQKAGTEATGWLKERRQSLVVGVVVLLLAGLGIGLANFMSTRGESRAAQELGEALRVLARPVAEGTETPTLEPGQQPPFKSATEKDEALVKELTAFRAKYPGARASVTATLALGEAQLRLGKPDEAQAAFDEFLRGAMPDDPLRATAIEGKGYAFEAKKDYAQAIGAYEQLTRETKGDFLNGMGLYHRARMLVLQGKKDEAAREFAQIPSVAPNTAAARLATDRMAVLAAEGVVVPPPIPVQVDGGLPVR